MGTIALLNLNEATCQSFGIDPECRLLGVPPTTGHREPDSLSGTTSKSCSPASLLSNVQPLYPLRASLKANRGLLPPSCRDLEVQHL